MHRGAILRLLPLSSCSATSLLFARGSFKDDAMAELLGLPKLHHESGEKESKLSSCPNAQKLVHHLQIR